MVKIITADNIRDLAGKGTVVKVVRAGSHEGVFRRPTEVTRLDEVGGLTTKTPTDFRRERDEKERLRRVAERGEVG